MSTVDYEPEIRPYLILAASIGFIAKLARLLRGNLEYATRIHNNGFASVWILERYQEEWHVILPRNAAIGGQVDNSSKVVITVILIGNEELAGVHLVVDVPAAGGEMSA